MLDFAGLHLPAVYTYSLSVVDMREDVASPVYPIAVELRGIPKHSWQRRHEQAMVRVHRRT